MSQLFRKYDASSNCSVHLTSLVVGGLGGWVADTALHSGSSNLLAALHSRSHLGRHHGSLSGGLRSLVLVLESFLELNALEILLVFNLFLYVLISLQKLIVLRLSQLESLVQVGLKLFLQGVHFILLLLNELALSGNDLLGTLLHVFFSLLRLQVQADLLDLVSFLIS